MKPETTLHQQSFWVQGSIEVSSGDMSSGEGGYYRYNLGKAPARQARNVVSAADESIIEVRGESALSNSAAIYAVRAGCCQVKRYGAIIKFSTKTARPSIFSSF